MSLFSFSFFSEWIDRKFPCSEWESLELKAFWWLNYYYFCFCCWYWRHTHTLVLGNSAFLVFDIKRQRLCIEKLLMCAGKQKKNTFNVKNARTHIKHHTMTHSMSMLLLPCCSCLCFSWSLQSVYFIECTFQVCCHLITNNKQQYDPAYTYGFLNICYVSLGGVKMSALILYTAYAASYNSYCGEHTNFIWFGHWRKWNLVRSKWTTKIEKRTYTVLGAVCCTCTCSFSNTWKITVYTQYTKMLSSNCWRRKKDTLIHSHSISIVWLLFSLVSVCDWIKCINAYESPNP